MTGAGGGGVISGGAGGAGRAGVTATNHRSPFPLELWSEAVYSRRSIPATLAAGAYAPEAAAPAPAEPAVPVALPDERRFPWSRRRCACGPQAPGRPIRPCSPRCCTTPTACSSTT